MHISLKIVSFQFLCTRRLEMGSLLFFLYHRHTVCVRSVICSTDLLNRLKHSHFLFRLYKILGLLSAERKLFMPCWHHGYNENIVTVVFMGASPAGIFRFTTAGLIFLWLPLKEFSILLLLVSAWSPKFTLNSECCFLKSKWRLRFRSPVSVIHFVHPASYSSWITESLKHRHEY